MAAAKCKLWDLKGVSTRSGSQSDSLLWEVTNCDWSIPISNFVEAKAGDFPTLVIVKTCAFRRRAFQCGVRGGLGWIENGSDLLVAFLTRLTLQPKHITPCVQSCKYSLRRRTHLHQAPKNSFFTSTIHEAASKRKGKERWLLLFLFSKHSCILENTRRAWRWTWSVPKYSPLPALMPGFTGSVKEGGAVVAAAAVAFSSSCFLMANTRLWSRFSSSLWASSLVTAPWRIMLLKGELTASLCTSSNASSPDAEESIRISPQEGFFAADSGMIRNWAWVVVGEREQDTQKNITLANNSALLLEVMWRRRSSYCRARYIKHVQFLMPVFPSILLES